MGGDVAGQNLRRYRMENFLLGGMPQISRIDSDQQVCRRVASLGLDTLEQDGGLVGNVADGHTALVGVAIEDRCSLRAE